MKTQVFRVNPDHFDEKELSLPAQWLGEGKLVAFPTETVYGLGADALNSDACDRIFTAKGRPHDNPLIVHVLHPDQIARYAYPESSPLFPIIAERFMPGPLTVILPKREIIPDSVTVGLSTVALRCPTHPVARALIRLSGVPVAAPSANLSGKPSPTSAKHVIDDMTGRVDAIVDGGEAEVGLESTVISLKGDEIHLLRPGAVTLTDLYTVTEHVRVSDAVLHQLKPNERPESPGMKYRHYAPSAPVTMVQGREESVLCYFLEKHQEGCGILCFDEDLMVLPQDKRVLSLGKRKDLKTQARRLFHALRQFDSMQLSHIYCRATSKEEIGLALSNRLLRACAFDTIDV